MSTSALASDGEIARRSRQHGIPLADLSAATRGAAEAVPERWARQFTIIPVMVTDRRIVVATANPFDLDCEHALAFASGREVVFQLADEHDILRRIEEIYRPESARQDGADRMVDVQHITA